MASRRKPTVEPAATEGWAELYRKAGEVFALAPWKHILEDRIFAMEDPDGGSLGFVSVMGRSGEHRAVALYLGRDGLTGLMRMLEEGLDQPEDLLEIPEIQVSWEDRDMLDARDREMIRALGLRYRGRMAWPQFRSYRAGFVPWHLEPEEVSLLGHALDQLPVLLPQLRSAPDLLDGASVLSCPLRRAAHRGDELAWTDGTLDLSAWMACGGEPHPDVAAAGGLVDGKELGRLRRLERLAVPIEVDLFVIPASIDQRDGRRPRQAYMLVAMDCLRGLVLHQQGLEAVPSWEAMHGMAVGWFVELCAMLQCVPREVRLRRPLLAEALHPIAVELGVDLLLVDALPAVYAVRAELYEMMGMD